MIQHSQPLPAGVPSCLPGHRPQLVRTRGAPVGGHRIGTPCPDAWHVECHACAVATIPSSSRAMTELRWCDPFTRIPLSELRFTRATAPTAIDRPQPITCQVR